MKSYTDIKQSKKLAEILPIESADCYWDYDEMQKFHRICWFEDGFNKESQLRFNENNVCAWSLAALMNLLPSEFTEKGKYSETTYNIDIRKYALTENVDLYQIAYGNYIFYEDGNRSWKDMVDTGEKENLIDAAFQMICWLKENNKL